MRRFLFALSVPFALAACGESVPKQQEVSKAVVRLPAVSGNPAAGYFTITGGSVGDRLMAISSPLAVRAEMHDMKMDGGMMKMVLITGGVEIAKGAEVEFKSGGKHVMLFDVSPKASPGRKIPLTFTFASGVTLSHEADLIAAGDDAPHAH